MDYFGDEMINVDEFVVLGWVGWLDIFQKSVKIYRL